MAFKSKLNLIGQELQNHSPFTLIGAGTGILLMLAGQAWFKGQAETLFSVFHPLHVVLSAMVTASLFEIHRKAKNFLVILVIGVVGAIGVATLSDCILPYFGETILGAAIPAHADIHDHEPEPAAEYTHEHDEHDHAHATDAAPAAPVRPEWHFGFIEEWYLVFPAAIIGVLLAYFKPTTHLPHASHVLVSTWASSAHMLMNTHAEMSATLLIGMFVVLFLAVWLPCCVSDIVFPLLFVRADGAHLGHACLLCGKKEKSDEN
jgi:hypothetical protein